MEAHHVITLQLRHSSPAILFSAANTISLLAKESNEIIEYAFDEIKELLSAGTQPQKKIIRQIRSVHSS